MKKKRYGIKHIDMRTTKFIPVKTVPIYLVTENHDTDWDGVPNNRDCNPWNPYVQGRFHDIVEQQKIKKRQKQREKSIYEQKRMKKNLERIQQQKPKRKSVPYKYVIVRIGNKWYNLGAFTVEGIEKAIEEAKQMKDVIQVIASTNKNEADRRNREKMVRQLETVVEYPFSRTDKLTKEQFMKRTYER